MDNESRLSVRLQGLVLGKILLQDIRRAGSGFLWFSVLLDLFGLEIQKITDVQEAAVSFLFVQISLIRSSALLTRSAVTETAPFTYGFSFSAVLPMPLPPDVANA